jgi:2-keto-3-deoxy-6-phosphogluconate aldolase
MGKTEQTVKLVQQYYDQGKQVLFITQRISMASSSIERLKKKYVMYSSLERVQKEGMKFEHY